VIKKKGKKRGGRTGTQRPPQHEKGKSQRKKKEGDMEKLHSPLSFKGEKGEV